MRLRRAAASASQLTISRIVGARAIEQECDERDDDGQASQFQPAAEPVVQATWIVRMRVAHGALLWRHAAPRVERPLWQMPATGKVPARASGWHRQRKRR